MSSCNNSDNGNNAGEVETVILTLTPTKVPYSHLKQLNQIINIENSVLSEPYLLLRRLELRYRAISRKSRINEHVHLLDSASVVKE